MLWWHLRRLRTKDAPTRLRAIKALGRSRNPGALPPLAAIVAEVRQRARTEEVRIGGRLYEITEGRDSAERQLAEKIAAIDALGDLGIDGALPLLVSAMIDPELADSARAALSRFGDRATAAMGAALASGSATWNLRHVLATELAARKWTPATPEERAGMNTMLGNYAEASREGAAALEVLWLALGWSGHENYCAIAAAILGADSSGEHRQKLTGYLRGEIESHRESTRDEYEGEQQALQRAELQSLKRALQLVGNRRVTHRNHKS